MYALLGDIQFNQVTAFDGLELQTGSDYAEHALIGRKPRLQVVGEKLDEMRWALVYHANYCDPEFEIGRLVLARRAHAPMPFIQGNGDYRGTFVITELSTVARHTDKLGTLISVEVSMTLREYTGDPAKPLAPAVIRAGASLPVPLTRQVLPGVSLTSAAVAAVKSGTSVVSGALNELSAVKVLVLTDPLSAYNRLQSIRRDIEGQLPKWQRMGTDLVQAVKRDAARAAVGIVADSMSSAFPHLQQVIVIAEAATQSTVATTVDSISPWAANAQSLLKDMTKPLAGLAAMVGGRQL